MSVGSLFIVPSERHFSGSLKLLVRPDVSAMLGEETSQVAVRREHFVMWWVPEGHQPTLEEALAKLEHLKENGDSDAAFGWSYRKDATQWKDNRCALVAAE